MIKICLLGDYSEEVLAHQAILLSMQIAQVKYDQLSYQWVQTIDIGNDVSKQFAQFDAIWCVPASPYENMQGVLDVIEFVRTHQIPFLGTCGGYQHALLEYAINVLNIQDADHAESNPETTQPIIHALACSLIEKTEIISIVKDSKLAKIYSKHSFEEMYHCSFGFNMDYLKQFESVNLKFSAFNQFDDVRAFEITNHPFYIGTSFQPERSAFEKQLHPIIEHFINSALEYKRLK